MHMVKHKVLFVVCCGKGYKYKIETLVSEKLHQRLDDVTHLAGHAFSSIDSHLT